MFDALLEDQERKFHQISDHDGRIRLVSTVLSVFEVKELLTVCVKLITSTCVYQCAFSLQLLNSLLEGTNLNNGIPFSFKLLPSLSDTSEIPQL